MSRKAGSTVPAYQHLKRTDQARVKIAGKVHYLGKHGTEASRQKYQRLLAEWFAANRDPIALQAQQHAKRATQDGPTVAHVVASFVTHARIYYRDAQGNQTEELDNFKHATRVLLQLYGTLPAAQFSPRCLTACQARMVQDGLARNTLNRRIGRIRYVFKWAIAQEIAPPSVFEGLRAIDGLKRGRSAAKETAPVRPVSDPHARAAIAQASRHVAAMIKLQLMTGMRSGELVIMRGADIEKTADVWTYTPTKHKTEHHGHTRFIYLGKQAQKIIAPFLKMDPAAYLFSPADADAERRAKLTEERKTPASCGNKPGTNQSDKPRKTPGQAYSVNSYAAAVAIACDKAFPPPEDLDAAAAKSWKKTHRFHPHQLRHAAATRFRREHGLDAARALLGQKTVEAAEIYAELDMGKARDVMRICG